MEYWTLVWRSWLFNNLFSLASKGRNINSPHYWPFVNENHHRYRNGPITRKASPYHYAIMLMGFSHHVMVCYAARRPTAYPGISGRDSGVYCRSGSVVVSWKPHWPIIQIYQISPSKTYQMDKKWSKFNSQSLTYLCLRLRSIKVFRWKKIVTYSSKSNDVHILKSQIIVTLYSR